MQLEIGLFLTIFRWPKCTIWAKLQVGQTSPRIDYVSASRSKLALVGSLFQGKFSQRNVSFLTFEPKFTSIFRVSEGQTQTDWPIDGEECCFNHLIDLHYATRGIQGWPQELVLFKVGSWN